jgi:transcriptional regulator with XRE-family HTH domain
MDTFGQWLVEEMGKRGISQTKLSKLSGLSQGTISNIISGRRGRGADSLQAIALALKIPRETVYRKAGLLDASRNTDEQIDEINHLAKDLSEEDRRTVIEFIRMLDRLRGNNK